MAAVKHRNRLSSMISSLSIQRNSVLARAIHLSSGRILNFDARKSTSHVPVQLWRLGDGLRIGAKGNGW
uniref:Uncharacterized protein n=1 Tax=Candidatus Kentrum sp. DK TaxID=2126562 RepID=A0A450SM31_9GAMM|nr:MAG: hypothetical protein BECKDK2373B_GA0170837_104822 [Candidatus Kentron sp. DK]